MRILLFVLTVALGGCVRHEVLWGRFSATQTDYDRDIKFCDHEAAVATQTPDSSMQSATGETLDHGMRESELIDRCMTAKGWTAPKPDQ